MLLQNPVTLDEINDRLLIDPSLLVAKQTYKHIKKELLNDDLGEVSVPHAFLECLTNGDEDLFAYYLSNALPESFSTLRKDLLKSKNIVAYKSPERFIESFQIIHTNLNYQFGETLITESLWEEWLFLQQESWIVSRSRKPFRRFIKSGAIALETGRDIFDGLAAKTLKLPKKGIPKSLTNRQRLRATAKWIAVGGSSVTSLFQPTIGLLGGLATNYFLLMDP